ncbi:apelin receptor 2 isoform X1 [Danio rerio]|uniref:Apelin receptor 2 n=3 Tax=Danio rerio TaxID=7955 RepID=F1QJG4_DANRE|nr:apelin receptor 2 [Danio rerio]AOX15719.1 apelin receptor 3 [Danio rerio]|eukprot:XP_001333516.2 apelin receptor B-like [Danio rerio]
MSGSLPFPSPSPFPSCDYTEWSPTWVLIPSVYLLVFVVGSLGNGLVLWVYLDRQARGRGRIGSGSKSSQTPDSPPCPSPTSTRTVTESLIISLALADLAFVMTLPLWAAYTALGYHWPFGQVLCQTSSYIVALNMYASVFSLTGLSVERYCVITRQRGNGSKQRTSSTRARWIVGIVWLAAGVLALPALLLRTVREPDLESGDDGDWQAGQSSSCLCDMDYSSLISSDLDPAEAEQAELMWSAALGLKSTLLGFLLPLVVLLVCYGWLGRLLSRHFSLGLRPDQKRQRRLLRIIITLVLAFFLCWLPFHTNKTLSAMVELGILPFSCRFDQWLVAAHPYSICLGYVNSCLNPLLYACCDPAFRKRCSGLLLCLWVKCKGQRAEEEKQQHQSSAVPSGTHEVTVSKDEQ